ncbi:hypothetical protein ABZY30_26360 [Streptomyces massasporeus]|uniref:hypothetical protein n=1 Tax=Streptomyces massasporeus TaxID=67324 RepID=UPI0033BB5AB1
MRSLAKNTAGLTRCLGLLAVLAVVGLLPWLSRRDSALTVLRARSAEQEATEEALAAIRRDLGLDAGPLSMLGQWAADLLHGDFGTSRVSGHDVLPSVVAGLQVSLGLMGAALVRRGGAAGRRADAPVLVRGRGSAGALAAVPEFLLATVVLLVFGVWLGWLPTSGWQSAEYLVCPRSPSASRRAGCSGGWWRTRCPPCSTSGGRSCGGAPG